MPRFQEHSSSSMVVFLLGTAALALVMLMLPSGHADPVPPPIGECLVKIGSCGLQISQAVVFNNATVSANCCCRLVKILGWPCHQELAKTIVLKPVYKANKTEILNRCQTVWNYCAPIASSMPSCPSY